ncbi:MAG: YoaK family protein [Candidatus Acidiferrales bacterium]
MADASFFNEYRPKILIALVLTLASGLVDIVGYAGIFHFFTAHLTGTTVQLGHGIIVRNWMDVSAAGIIVAAFLCGSIFARSLIEFGSRIRIRRIASVTLAIEAILLAAVAYERLNLTATTYSSLALLAGAMGIQTATLTGIGPLTVHTTFVTGMVNKIGQLVSHITFRAYDLLKTKSRSVSVQRAQREDRQMTLFLLCVWLFYVGGAAAGTWSFAVWGMRALFIAVGLLLISIASDRLCPVSIKEEKEQLER